VTDKTKVEGCECEATCHLDDEQEQEQRLSPVSVMDFQSQEDGDDDGGGCDGHSDGEGTSPTFERSLAMANIRSKFLLSIWLHCEASSVVHWVTPSIAPCKLNCSVSCAYVSFSFLYDDMNLSRTTIGHNGASCCCYC